MLITLILVMGYVLNLVSEYSVNERRVDLLTKANILANFAAENDFEDLEGVKEFKKRAEIVGNARVMYIDEDAKVLFDTSEAANLAGKTMLVSQVANALGGTENIETKAENDKNYIIAAVPVRAAGMVSGVIYLQENADDMIAYHDHMKRSLLVLSAIMCVVIAILSLALSHLFTAPISKIKEKIKYMSENKIRKTIDYHGSNEINELVEEFNKMVAQLNVVEERRQQFVSNASHELKTPLSSLKLICDSILQNPDVDMEIVKEFLCDMNDEVDRLTRITNKLLSLTKMDASVEETEMVELSVINLKGLMRRIVKSLKPLAEEKKIDFEILLPEDVYATVDADKLWEAVYNIVDNSIKYTGEGGWVYVEMYRDKQEVFITVADNGIGMQEEETEKIFDRFYRVDKARARETGGTGLGLSIAQSSVELHGGKIFVESHEDVGSLFRIIIPTVANIEEKKEE